MTKRVWWVASLRDALRVAQPRPKAIPCLGVQTLVLSSVMWKRKRVEAALFSKNGSTEQISEEAAVEAKVVKNIMNERESMT